MRSPRLSRAATICGLIAGIGVLAGCTSAAHHSAASSSSVGGSPSASQSSAGLVASSSTASTPGSPATSGSSTAAAATLPTTLAAARTLIATGHVVTVKNYEMGSFSPATPAQHLDYGFHFSTPSRNIRCTLITGSNQELLCEIDQASVVVPPKPADCHLNWARTISLHVNAVAIGSCTGDDEVTFHSNVLAYGSVLREGGLSCYSASAGLVCVDGTKGFTLNRDAFTALG